LPGSELSSKKKEDENLPGPTLIYRNDSAGAASSSGDSGASDSSDGDSSPSSSQGDLDDDNNEELGLKPNFSPKVNQNQNPNSDVATAELPLPDDTPQEGFWERI
jgi:hypothetical protein